MTCLTGAPFQSLALPAAFAILHLALASAASFPLAVALIRRLYSVCGVKPLLRSRNE